MKIVCLLLVTAAAACERVSPTSDKATTSPSPISSSAQRISPGPAIEPEADQDLKTLRSELIIPMSGARAGELRNTYDDARGEGRRHDAIDIPAARGTPVLSASKGRVLKLFTSKAGGLMIYAADSSERFILMYAHLDSYAPLLVDGARIAQGQTLGFVGTTGNAPLEVPHLHFAIARSRDVSRWWEGSPVNPFPLLKSIGN